MKKQMARRLTPSEANTKESTRSKRKSEIPEGLSGLTLKCCMCEEMKQIVRIILIKHNLCIMNVGDPADSTSTDLPRGIIFFQRRDHSSMVLSNGVNP